jgi:hypothetical protein
MGQVFFVRPASRLFKNFGWLMNFSADIRISRISAKSNFSAYIRLITKFFDWDTAENFYKT